MVEQFTAVKNRFSVRCSHQKITVDESLNSVECRDCGEKLNPIWVLAQMAERERLAIQNLNLINELKEKALSKTRG